MCTQAGVDGELESLQSDLAEKEAACLVAADEVDALNCQLVEKETALKVGTGPMTVRVFCGSAQGCGTAPAPGLRGSIRPARAHGAPHGLRCFVDYTKHRLIYSFPHESQEEWCCGVVVVLRCVTIVDADVDPGE